jgi:hypothetical protein
MSFKNNEKRKGNQFTPCLTPFAQSKYSDIQLLYEIIYLILFILLYADDTALLAETANDLQTQLDAFYEYCNLWKLKVNADKTKVMVFENNEKRKGNRFTPCLTPFAQSKYSDIQLLYEIQGFILSYILIITLYILPLILFMQKLSY